MRHLRFLLWASLLVPAAAMAQGALEQAVNSIGSALPSLEPSGICTGNGACGFVDIAHGIVVRVRPVLTGIGVLVIVIFGYRMMIAQEDDAVTKSRTILTATITGLVMAYLIDPFIAAFYGQAGEVPQGAMVEGAAVLARELNGIVNWALILVAGLAITMIALSAAKALAQGTSEEGVGNMRKTVFSVIFGIVLIVIRFVISDGFVQSTGNPAPLLASLLRPVSFLMGFLALVAVIIVVYAGFLYVLSLGKEEQATKAKSLLLRAATGAVVIIISLALVNFVILPGVQ